MCNHILKYCGIWQDCIVVVSGDGYTRWIIANLPDFFTPYAVSSQFSGYFIFVALVFQIFPQYTSNKKCSSKNYLPAIPAMASDAKYFTSTSASTLSLSRTGLTCVCMQLK